MNGIVTAVREPDNLSDDVDGSPHTLGLDLPDGYFVGEHARDFENAVVGDAWNTPLEPVSDDHTLPWPCDLSADVADRLRAAAEQVRAVESDEPNIAESTGTQGDVADESATPSPETGNSLLRLAKLLVADEHLMPEPDVADAGESQDAFDEAVRAKGERILAAGRQNVTSLQARAGSMGERDSRAYWRGLVRPIPHVASPAAQLGTRFHAWAERFIMADADVDGIGGTEGAAGMAAQSRAELIALIGDTQVDADNGGVQSQDAPSQDAQLRDERKLAAWQRRLVASPWAKRRPAWAERQLVVDMPQLGTIVNGKLDAVFFGGLDETDETKRYTVVDWKTGVKPRRPDEIKEKLAQLDLYRLLLAAMEGVPLDAIDACLYYVSEPHEADRELDALDKTEEEILAELSYGIPQQSDND